MKNYFQFIKESSNKEEIIYIKDLEEDNFFLADFLNKKLKGREIKLYRYDISSQSYLPFVRNLDIYFYVKGVKFRNFDVVIFVMPDEVGFLKIDQYCKIVVKNIERKISTIDPYGEEIWESLKNDEELTINAHDYLETWENTIKNRYRNIKTGEIKNLEEIFEIPKHYYRDKFIGIYDYKSIFDVLDLNYKPHNRFYESDKLFIEEIIQKKRMYFSIGIGPKFKIMDAHPKKINYRGKGKYHKYKNHRIIIPKTSFTICRLYKYFDDLRTIFSDRRIKAGENVFKMPINMPYFANFDLHIYPNNKSNFHFSIFNRGLFPRDFKSFYVNVFEPIISLKPIIFDPTIDPYGEEDWFDEF